MLSAGGYCSEARLPLVCRSIRAPPSERRVSAPLPGRAETTTDAQVLTRRPHGPRGRAVGERSRHCPDRPGVRALHLRGRMEHSPRAVGHLPDRLRREHQAGAREAGRGRHPDLVGRLRVHRPHAGGLHPWRLVVGDVLRRHREGPPRTGEVRVRLQLAQRRDGASRLLPAIHRRRRQAGSGKGISAWLPT